MNKPYISLTTLVLEVVGLISMIISMIFACIGLFDASRMSIVFVLSMMACEVIFILIIHLMPASMWNMPVKVKERNAIKVYSDVVIMLASIGLELGLYTLYSVIVDAKPDSFIIWGVTVLCIACFASIIYGIYALVRDNRR